MKYSAKFLFVILCLLLSCGASAYFRTVHKILPDPLPAELEDVEELRRLVDIAWIIPITVAGNDAYVYPLYIGYRVHPDMANSSNWPFIDDLMDRSRSYWSEYDGSDMRLSILKDEYSAYYYEPWAKVFVCARLKWHIGPINKWSVSIL